MTNWNWIWLVTGKLHCLLLFQIPMIPLIFIVSIMYTQLFYLLCDRADDVYGGRLPNSCAVSPGRVLRTSDKIPKISKKTDLLRLESRGKSQLLLFLQSKVSA